MKDNLAKFDAVVADLRALYDRKNKDYGDSFNRSLNKRGLVAYIVRAEDKFERIDNLLRNKALVNDEAIEDTIRDLANYSIMAVMWLEEQKGMAHANTSD
jgi:glutaredoxin 2